MALTDIEDGGMIAPRRATRHWSPMTEDHPVGVSYPFTDATPSCAGLGDLFFPEAGAGSTADRLAVEKLCANCPVYFACDDWGRTHQEYGIWAGNKPRSRR